MTAEQQRDQLLKRMLPALGITVLYFTIGSGFVTNKFKKAKEDYALMQSKGVNASALPAKEQQQNQLKTEVTKLEEEYKKIHSELATNSSFLNRTASQNDTLDQLSVLLANHNLQVLEEKRNDKTKDALSQALRDTQHWLTELFPTPTTGDKTVKDTDLQIWTVQYIGSYIDTYRALSALADSDIRVLPVSLTMQPLKTETTPSGKLAWTLNLWL